MKIAVVAASGRSGRLVASRSLELGHEVIAVVRTASKAPAGTTPAVAESRDVAALTAAFEGVDAVISCLGQVKADADARLLESSARAIVEAMAAAGVRRLVVVSASGAFINAGDDPITRFAAKPILNRVLRDNMNDTRAMEAVLEASDLDWTAIRPSQLVTRPAKATYRSRVDLNLPWGFQTSYEAVARAALDALGTPAWVRHPVAVAD